MLHATFALRDATGLRLDPYMRKWVGSTFSVYFATAANLFWFKLWGFLELLGIFP